MQLVSKQYKTHRDLGQRSQGYIQVVFGLINQEAQRNASVDSDCKDYSRYENIFNVPEDLVEYATFEQDFTKVDGSMYFLPEEKENYILPTRFISNEFATTYEDFILTIYTNTEPIDFRGLTIDFGEKYPIDFDIITDNEVFEVRGNTESLFMTEHVFRDITYMRFKILKMENDHLYLRINHFKFGYGLSYTNNDITSASFESYVSPICADIPQMDISVSLTNYDQYFNVDNPDSAINFLETGQEMKVYFGQEIEKGQIEWLDEIKLSCTDWESDDSSATIRASDFVRNLNTEYYKGKVGYRTYYELLEDILQEANIEEYYIDHRLKSFGTRNPIPKVPWKEALQIIANATRCVLEQRRDGIISIKSSFIPTQNVLASQNAYGRMKASNQNLLEDTEKDEYIRTMAKDSIKVDGSMYFMNGTAMEQHPRDIGYLIESQNAAGVINKLVTRIELESQYSFYGLTVKFGSSLCKELRVVTLNNGQVVEDFTYDKIEQITVIQHYFKDFDQIEVYVTKLEPYSACYINSVLLGDVTDFRMKQFDMMSNLKMTKQELTKEVIVPYRTYLEGSERVSIATEELKNGFTEDVITYQFDEAHYAYEFSLDKEDTGDVNFEILESGAYFVKARIKVNDGIEHRAELTGIKYIVSEKSVSKILNVRGNTVTWDNPMTDDALEARKLCDWVADYYNSPIEYEYDTRGNPELEANDIIYQDNQFVSDLKVRVHKVNLDFNGAFRGKVITRRLRDGMGTT